MEAGDVISHSDFRRPLGIWLTFLLCCVVLEDILVWPWQFSLENSLRSTWDRIHEHLYPRMARREHASPRAGTDNGGAASWEPSWIQHLGREKVFLLFLSMPTPLWGKGQIYIMKWKQGQVREKGSCLILETKTLEIWLKAQTLPWEQASNYYGKSKCALDFFVPLCKWQIFSLNTF